MEQFCSIYYLPEPQKNLHFNKTLTIQKQIGKNHLVCLSHKMCLGTENLNYEVFFMKKIILILAGALLFSASTFAMDLSVVV